VSMSRVFLSHSSRDKRQAMAVKAWLSEREPGLVEEIFLDLDPHTGIRPGERWRQALQQANARCEAVICLLSKNWLNSHECQAEFRYAENLGKTILCARLEPVPDTNITSEWQRCDLFPDHGPTTALDIGDGGNRWCWTASVFSGCGRRCARWGLGPSISRGHRRAILTAPRTGGGHRLRKLMRRCFSGAMPRFCAAWICCMGCARPGCSPAARLAAQAGARVAGSRRPRGYSRCLRRPRSPRFAQGSRRDSHFVNRHRVSGISGGVVLPLPRRRCIRRSLPAAGPVCSSRDIPSVGALAALG
jgi:TIR domain